MDPFDRDACEFLTPEVGLPLPRDEGPKVLDYKMPAAIWFVEGALETIIDRRCAHDVEDARLVYDDVPFWLAIMLGLAAGEEEEVLELAEDFRGRDPAVPILLVSARPADAALTARALLLDAHIVVDGADLGPVLVAYLRRVVERRGSLEDRLVGAMTSVYGLSTNDARIVRLVIAGEQRADIAKMLWISVNTVDRHAQRIRDKIGRPLKSLRGRTAEELLEELEAKIEKARTAGRT